LNVSEEVKNVLGEVLKLGNGARQFDADTALFGAIAEFDSLAAVAVIATLEDRFGFVFEDDEITADVFETVGSLTRFIERKLTI
jgi:acyl carrier protein